MYRMGNLLQNKVCILDKSGYITKRKVERSLLWSWFVVRSGSRKICLKFLKRTTRELIAHLQISSLKKYLKLTTMECF